MEITKNSIYKLGRHYLMYGDSRDPKTYELLTKVSNLKPTLTLTDPPYGYKVQHDNGAVGGNGGRLTGMIKHDCKVDNRSFSQMLGNQDTTTAEEVISLYKNYTKHLICFGANMFTKVLDKSRGWAVWHKHMSGDFGQGELIYTSYKKPIHIFDYTWNGAIRQGSKKIELAKRIHPTQKPVGLLKEIIEYYAPNEDVIIDPFCGSGSTLIACELLNKTCLTIELDVDYIDAVIKRYKDLTNNTVECIN